jgi:hypothetical protein
MSCHYVACWSRVALICRYCQRSIGSPSQPPTRLTRARSGVRGEIQTFLTTRRARISPEQAGLPAYGGERRRVSGLRRDEVALLAGISSQYYQTELQGDLPDQVPDRAILTVDVGGRQQVVGLLGVGLHREPGSPTQDALTLLASWAAGTTHASDHENQDRRLDLHTGSGTDPTTPEDAGRND